jgi:hypothetical protein
MLPFDGTSASFQYEAGGIIVITILDRATDTSGSNQVVWQVTDSAGTVIHFPSP